MNQALKQYRSWMSLFGSRLKDIRLSINISPLQLLDENLIDDLCDLMNVYQVPASSLMFELTENAIMTHPQRSIHVLNQLKDLGLRFSMDDFGTGYSSLNYMRYLPISQIKIDRSFVRAFEHSRQDAAIVKATISLAEALGVEVIAEGVETQNELKFLRDAGCKYIQGFYFSHPLNAQGMEEYIEVNV